MYGFDGATPGHFGFPFGALAEAEMKKSAAAARFGELGQLCRTDYVREVTDASAAGSAAKPDMPRGRGCFVNTTSCKDVTAQIQALTHEELPVFCRYMHAYMHIFVGVYSNTLTRVCVCV